jgi:hypothetical protein
MKTMENNGGNNMFKLTFAPAEPAYSLSDMRRARRRRRSWHQAVAASSPQTPAPTPAPGDEEELRK